LDLVLLAVVAPASVTLLFSGSARLGQTSGVLCGALLGGLLASLILGPAAQARGMVRPCGILFCGIMLAGNSFAELTTPHALALGSAAPLAALVEFAPRGWNGKAKWALQIGLAAAVAGWVCFSAHAAFVRATQY
jgi:hypothetical protein